MATIAVMLVKCMVFRVDDLTWQVCLPSLIEGRATLGFAAANCENGDGRTIFRFFHAQN